MKTLFALAFAAVAFAAVAFAALTLAAVALAMPVAAHAAESPAYCGRGSFVASAMARPADSDVGNVDGAIVEIAKRCSPGDTLTLSRGSVALVARVCSPGSISTVFDRGTSYVLCTMRAPLPSR